MRRGTAALALCGALACLALLGGCGKKGDLAPLPGEYSAFTWPQLYPKPSTVVPGAPEETEVRPAPPPPETQGFDHPGGLGGLGGRDLDRTTIRVYPAQ